jgi:hypothetical protein
MRTICPDWPGTAIHQISVSQVARITGVSQGYLAIYLENVKAIFILLFLLCHISLCVKIRYCLHFFACYSYENVLHASG